VKKLLNRVKNFFNDMLNPIAIALVKVHITPNVLSLTGIVLAFISAFLYYNEDLWLAASLLLVSGFLDALDGAVARAGRKVTKFGGFLDSLLDRYADSAVIVAIIIAGLCDLLFGLAALIGTLLVSYSRARAESEGIQMSGIGLMERAERIVLLVVASFLNVLWIAIILLALLTNVTVIHRAVYAWRNLRH